MGVQVVEELLADGKGAAREFDDRSAVVVDSLSSVTEKQGDVFEISRRADRRDRARFGQISRDGEDRGTTQRMSHEELRRAMVVS